VAEWNQLRSLLGGLNSGNACGRENVAFRNSIGCDQLKRFPLELNASGCNGPSFTERLRRNINHFRATIGANVSEFFHCLVVLSEAKNV
jgi:hypothetical protein